MTREEFEQYAKEQGLVVWSKEMSDKAINALTAIEDIKQEIPKLGLGIIGQNLVLECIDKHIKGEQE